MRTVSHRCSRRGFVPGVNALRGRLCNGNRMDGPSTSICLPGPRMGCRCTVRTPTRHSRSAAQPRLHRGSVEAADEATRPPEAISPASPTRKLSTNAKTMTVPEMEPSSTGRARGAAIRLSRQV